MTTIKHHQGFTLIELMITVAIVGILAAIAYPSYTAQVQKSRRADAQIALQEIAQRQEAYFLRNSSYAHDLSIPIPDDPSVKSLRYGTVSHDEHYDLTVFATDRDGGGCDGTNNDACINYTVVATPVFGGLQVHDTPCQVFTLDDRGRRRGGTTATTAAADNAQTCWK
ncbi:type IV pilin protein [Thiothrix subterranea]|uniref:type IV pilin protein n=1 Tax=Thiothrix subterranea TaxID=2735563 RepID=UPI001AF50BAB|nr:type IV pilin protein [Thiothrix subterranea]QQZ30110.1 type IV pilin protein [Thiothrix subterranea]